jgi:hypothetical protein
MPTHIPNGRSRSVLGKTQEVTAETLVAYLVRTADMSDLHHKAHIICGVYNADRWIHHLERVLAPYGNAAFRNAEWAKQFIDCYFDVINTVQETLSTNTGVAL